MTSRKNTRRLSLRSTLPLSSGSHPPCCALFAEGVDLRNRIITEPTFAKIQNAAPQRRFFHNASDRFTLLRRRSKGHPDAAFVGSKREFHPLPRQTNYE